MHLHYTPTFARAFVVAGRIMIANRRRPVVTDELGAAVPKSVRANPVTPSDAVHRELHTSTRNASRCIAEARRRGFPNNEDAH
jgi:hypothetical protein